MPPPASKKKINKKNKKIKEHKHLKEQIEKQTTNNKGKRKENNATKKENNVLKRYWFFGKGVCNSFPIDKLTDKLWEDGLIRMACLKI